MTAVAPALRGLPPVASEGQLDTVSTSHAGHNVIEHDHPRKWCSGKYRCETCQKWFTSTPCDVATGSASVRLSQTQRR